MQLTEVREYARRHGWDVVEYMEKESSVKRRPEFERLLADAKRRKVDVVLVWKIDRFARSMKHFVDLILDLKSWGGGLVSVTQSIDSRDESPMGRFTLGLFGLLAELERGMILDRVHSGLKEYQRAYTAGRVGAERHSRSKKDLPIGRPRAIYRRDKVVELRKQGMSWRAIAKQLEVPFSTIRPRNRVCANPFCALPNP